MDPQAKAAEAGVFPVSFVWGFTKDSTATVSTKVEIQLVDPLALQPCLAASVTFSDTANFDAEYVIYAGEEPTDGE